MDSAACLEKAVKTKMLERSLEIAIDPEVYERLRGEMASGDDQR
jgi:predicted RNA-binding protein YlxR (DUF448 family)